MATAIASMTNDFASMTTGANYLPDELLARILAPVDLKSLVQARAVCKSWRASVESKEVSDLRATATERWPSLAEPLIALIGGRRFETSRRTCDRRRRRRSATWWKWTARRRPATSGRCARA